MLQTATSKKSSQHSSHKTTLIFGKALGFLVMLRHGFAFGIVLNFPAVCFIGSDAGKTKKRYRNACRSGFTDSGRAEGCVRWNLAGQEVAVMRAAVFLDQTHPHPRVMFERGHLVRVNRVAQVTGNHDGES